MFIDDQSSDRKSHNFATNSQMRINGNKCGRTKKEGRNTQIPCAIHRNKKNTGRHPDSQEYSVRNAVGIRVLKGKRVFSPTVVLQSFQTFCIIMHNNAVWKPVE